MNLSDPGHQQAAARDHLLILNSERHEIQYKQKKRFDIPADA
jgi:hypothetical protein